MAAFDPAVYALRKKAQRKRIDDLWVKQNGQCFYCTWPMLHPREHAPMEGAGPSPLLATQDHKIPRSQLPRGSKWDAHNIVLACYTCNQKKGDKTPAEFEVSHRGWLMVRRLEALTMRIGRLTKKGGRRANLLANMPMPAPPS